MRSLRAMLTVRLLLGGFFVAGLAGAAVFWQVRSLLVREFDAGLCVTAQSLATLVEGKADGRMEMDFSAETLPQYGRAGGAEGFDVRDSAGGEIRRSPSLGDAELPFWRLDPGAVRYADVEMADGRVWRCLGLGIHPQAENVDGELQSTRGVTAVLVAGRDRSGLDRMLMRLGWVLSIIVGVLSLLVVMLARWCARWSTAPLVRLGERAAVMDGSHLSERFSGEEIPEELRPVVDRLNGLMERLEEAFARERRFTGTAAHELRTPLTEIRALAEVNLIAPGGEEERISSWRDVLESVVRMQDLAERLLALARAEESGGVAGPVVLGDLWADVHAACMQRSAGRAVVWDCDVPPELRVSADPVLLRIVLTNLCENACTYAPPGSTVRVRGGDGPHVFSIANEAGDLVEEDLPRLCERFWRKDAARSYAGHHGLGLAVAVEAARAAGGGLSIRLDQGIVRFELMLAVVA